MAGRYPSGFSGDGGPATDAQLYRPWDVAVDPDSSLYIVDSWNHRIRRVSASGIITTVAGSIRGFGGDGGPATQARLNQPHGVALGPNGSFYIADTQNNRIRYVDATGVITTVAGTGTAGFSGDGGLAICGAAQSSRCDRAQSRWQPVHRRYRQSARTADQPRRVHHDDRGYGCCGFRWRWRRGVSGQTKLSARCGSGAGWQRVCGRSKQLSRAPHRHERDHHHDGGRRHTHDGRHPGHAVQLDFVTAVAVDASGTAYFAHSSGSNAGRVRSVSPDGIAQTVAGGTSPLVCVNSAGLDIGDGGPAVNSRLCQPRGLGVLPGNGPAARLYIADTYVERVRQIGLPLPEYTADPIFIPSTDGTLLYQFDANGRHLRTFDALNHTALLTFTYNANGLLDAIADANHNVTTIERTNALTPTAIIAPFGQRTVLTLDAHGYLNTVTDPLTHAYTFTYSSGGLLQTLTDPRGHAFNFDYNAQGRLISGSKSGRRRTRSRSDRKRHGVHDHRRYGRRPPCKLCGGLPADRPTNPIEPLPRRHAQRGRDRHELLHRHHADQPDADRLTIGA